GWQCSGKQRDAADLHVISDGGDTVDGAGHGFGTGGCPSICGAGEIRAGHHDEVDIDTGDIVLAPGSGGIAGDDLSLVFPDAGGIDGKVEGIGTIDVKILD